MFHYVVYAAYLNQFVFVRNALQWRKTLALRKNQHNNKFSHQDEAMDKETDASIATRFQEYNESLRELLSSVKESFETNNYLTKVSGQED